VVSEALSITSAYPASRDASPSFTYSPLQECPSASATWRRISATSVRMAGSRDQRSRMILRQPPARLYAMMARNIATSASSLIASP
jgi:hypothetical protein